MNVLYIREWNVFVCFEIVRMCLLFSFGRAGISKDSSVFTIRIFEPCTE
jgi:hypothetical protein